MKAMKKIISIVCIVMIALSSLVFTGCGKESNSVVGEWVYKLGDSEYIFKFNEDGTGSYTAWGNEAKFTYEDDGENISILYDGTTSANKYSYKVDRKKLTFTDSYGINVEYTKK